VGGDPARGRQAALESAGLIKEAVAEADLIFVTAGMGGGTGTGAAPVGAQTAKEISTALVIGVVTRPFEFEGTVRANQADQGIHEMRKYVDCLLVIPNDRLRDIVDSDTAATEAYRIADDVLRQAIQGISDVITTAGIINVDFQDVRKIMTKSGEALIGIGRASGEKRHLEAASKAIHSPLLENAVYHGIEPLTEGGIIDIDISEKNGQLHLSVSNPLTDKAVQSDGNHLALSNIRERLALLFDVEAEYRVERNDDSYHVHIVIPLRDLT